MSVCLNKKILAAEMPENTQLYGGHMYHISSTQMTYFDAVDYCAEALPDGYVALGNNPDETDFIRM